MMLQHITDAESKQVPLFVRSSLLAFSCVLKRTSEKFDQLEKHIKPLLKVILSGDFLQSENTGVLQCVLRVANALVIASGKLCQNYQTDFFKIMLQLGAIPQLVQEKP